jgi:hypothetical protein
MTLTQAPSTHSTRVVEGKSSRRKHTRTRFALLAAAALLTLSAPLLFAQASPHIDTVDPASGKVSDTITLTGENLEKSHVSAFFLSDKKSDFKAAIVEQSAEKVVIKVPQVAPGDYNVSVQTGNTILIQPVRFTVEQ